MERDFLAFLVRWLRGHGWYTSQSSIGGITALAKFGRLIYHLYCARTYGLADDFRSKMVETDTLACLLDLVKDHDSDVRRLSVNAITTLAEFSGFPYHFVLCKESQGLMIRQTIPAPR